MRTTLLLEAYHIETPQETNCTDPDELTVRLCETDGVAIFTQIAYNSATLSLT